MTETDICNLALDILKEAEIASINDGRPIARWCKRNFAIERDAALAVAPWVFAIKRAALPAGATPAFGWAYGYPLPADYIRSLGFNYDGTFNYPRLSHQIEAGVLMANQAGPAYLRYIYRNENYGTYPATFIRYLAARMASGAAHWLTGKTSYVQIAAAMMQERMQEAWATNAIEGDAEMASDDDIISARYAPT
jgi:hypothetical protein